MRICSLLPSATDIVLALGLRDQLVAVTHECDLPSSEHRIPVITRSPIADSRRGSREIHTHVTAAAHAGSTLYALDQALLERLEPDVILTQELCDVCAISYTEVATAVHRLDVALPARRTVLSLEPKTLDGILGAIEQVGRATGVAERARSLADRLRERIDRVATIARRAPVRPRVFAMEWLDPPYTAGHWVPEMIRLAGGHDALGAEGAPSIEVSWTQIITYDPEVLLFMPCSFDLSRTISELATIDPPRGWERLTAVATRRVFAVDAARYFSRSGPSTVDGLQVLAEIMHPELFARTSPVDAWRRLASPWAGEVTTG
jgi:iron complex transport system substrate-binding protein